MTEQYAILDFVDNISEHVFYSSDDFLKAIKRLEDDPNREPGTVTNVYWSPDNILMLGVYRAICFYVYEV